MFQIFGNLDIYERTIFLLQVGRVSFLHHAYMKATNLELIYCDFEKICRIWLFYIYICKLAMISKGTATSVIEPPESPWEGDAASTVRGALRSSPEYS